MLLRSGKLQEFNLIPKKRPYRKLQHNTNKINMAEPHNDNGQNVVLVGEIEKYTLHPP